MVVGVDVHHDTSKARQSVMGFVASINRSVLFTIYWCYSCSALQIYSPLLFLGLYYEQYCVVFLGSYKLFFSFNSAITRWYSRVTFQGPNEELINGFTVCLLDALHKYHEVYALTYQCWKFILSAVMWLQYLQFC